MKPSGALRLVCRGLRCRALTPAHWFGWREAGEIKRYTPSENQEVNGRRGRRVGIAYELESGEIIYVPE